MLALVVGSVAIEHLTEESELSSIGALLALASPSVVIFFFLGVLKLHIGYATDSASMKKDAASSGVSAPLIRSHATPAPSRSSWRPAAMHAKLPPTS